MEKIQVLMSTYNGERFVEEQIKSILGQENVIVELLIRDDGSTDETVKILKNISKKYDNINVIYGDNIGVKHSFLELINSSRQSDFYAFSDQDDVWLPNKLFEAVRLFKGTNKPELYISKTTLVDQKLKKIGIDSYIAKSQRLEELVIKNNGVGCTMVFNRELKSKILLVDIKDTSKKVLHDYWIYLICLIFEGQVHYDINSYILYRQHENNVIGNTDSFFTKLKNNGLLNSDKVRSNNVKELYSHYNSHITNNEIRRFLYDIVYYDVKLKSKINLLLNYRLRTSNIIETINIKFLILLNKF